MAQQLFLKFQQSCLHYQPSPENSLLVRHSLVVQLFLPVLLLLLLFVVLAILNFLHDLPQPLAQQVILLQPRFTCSLFNLKFVLILKSAELNSRAIALLPLLSTTLDSIFWVTKAHLLKLLDYQLFSNRWQYFNFLPVHFRAIFIAHYQYPRGFSYSSTLISNPEGTLVTTYSKNLKILQKFKKEMRISRQRNQTKVKLKLCARKPNKSKQKS